MSETVLVALISGPIGGAVVAIIGWLRGRRKDDADADLTIGSAWQAIVDELRGDIADLRGRVDELEDELRTAKREEQRLRDEVRRYRAISRSLLRYVGRLRDALIASGADVPEMPQDVEDAVTSIDLQ